MLLSIARAGPWSAHPPRCPRACPNRTHRRQALLFCGTPVRILKETEQWCEVAVGTDDRLSGWVPREQLAFLATIWTESKPFLRKSSARKVECRGRHRYASPDMQSTCPLEEGAWLRNRGPPGMACILLTRMGKRSSRRRNAAFSKFRRRAADRPRPSPPFCRYRSLHVAELPVRRARSNARRFHFDMAFDRHTPQRFQQASHLPDGHAPRGQQRHQRVPSDGQRSLSDHGASLIASNAPFARAPVRRIPKRLKATAA